ncbi:MAG: hypothetical protein R3F16_12650 [Myxococcota bacterium]
MSARRSGLARSMLGWVALLLCAGGAAAEAPDAPSVEVLFEVRLCADDESAAVEIHVEQQGGQLRRLRFALPDERMRGFEGDGEIREASGEVVWVLPRLGGSLRYMAVVDHLRDPAEYDARCTDDWALLRGSDLVPIATATVVEGSVARTRLRFRLPSGWQVVTPFEAIEPRLYRIDRPGRLFEAPRGWIMAGDLRVLDAEIGSTRVTFASPAGQETRDRDRRALLRWALPVLNEILGTASRRWLVVSADDPMWRGGLSGPDSLYLHADRPLIAPDDTSPLLHEIVHVAMGAEAGPESDWIVEGLAELYSLELLRRAGALSGPEWERALAGMRKEAAGVESLAEGPTTGDATKRAVLVLHELDRRIRSVTKGDASLDDVLRRLVEGDREPLTKDGLQRLVESLTGDSMDSFFGSLPD